MKDPFAETMKSLDKALTLTLIALIASTFILGALVATAILI